MRRARSAEDLEKHGDIGRDKVLAVDSEGAGVRVQSDVKLDRDVRRRRATRCSGVSLRVQVRLEQKARK